MECVFQSNGCKDNTRTKEQQEHIQLLTNQNAALVTMVQEQQRKIEELMMTSKNLFEKMTSTNNKEQSRGKQNNRNGRQGNKKKWCDNCKSWI